MRKTVSLDDEIWKAADSLCERDSVSFSKLVSDSLRAKLKKEGVIGGSESDLILKAKENGVDVRKILGDAIAKNKRNEKRKNINGSSQAARG